MTNNSNNSNNSNSKKNTFLQKCKIFFENIDCVLQCISDDKNIEDIEEIEKNMETNEDIFILKKNNEIIYLIGRESIKI